MAKLSEVCESVDFILVPKRELKASEVLGITFLKRAFPKLEFTFCENEVPQLNAEKLFQNYKDQKICHLLWEEYLRNSFLYVYDSYTCSTIEEIFISKIDEDCSNKDYNNINPNVYFLYKFVKFYNIDCSDRYDLNLFYNLVEVTSHLFDQAVKQSSSSLNNILRAAWQI